MTPCVPEASDDIWLYSAVDMTVKRLVKGFGSPRMFPALAPRPIYRLAEHRYLQGRRG